MYALNLFSIKMSATDTKSLIVDYVQYQLRKKSLSWLRHPDTNDDDPPQGKVNLTMRVLSEEFKERYTQVLKVAGEVPMLNTDAECSRYSFRLGSGLRLVLGLALGLLSVYFRFRTLHISVTGFVNCCHATNLNLIYVNQSQ